MLRALARVCVCLRCHIGRQMMEGKNMKLKICMLISLPTEWEYGEKAIDRLVYAKMQMSHSNR